MRAGQRFDPQAQGGHGIFGITLKVRFLWNSFKEWRQKWEAHRAATLWLPVLLNDETQEIEPEVLSEWRLRSSTHFVSRPFLTVVLCGYGRLSELLRLPKLKPLGTPIRARLPLDYATAKQLSELLTHLFDS